MVRHARFHRGARGGSSLLTGILLVACSSSPGGASTDAGHGPDVTVTPPRADAGDASPRDASVGADSNAARDGAGTDALALDGTPSDSSSVRDASNDSWPATDVGTPNDAVAESSHSGGLHDAATDAFKADALATLPEAGDGQTPDAHGTSSSPPTDASGVDAPVDAGFDAGPPALGYVGRIDWSQTAGPRFEWSGTQVFIRFQGTGVTLQMADYGNYFDIYIDGTLQPNSIMGVGGNGTIDYVLASGLTNGTHEVIVYRRTEADVSLTQILGVTFPAGGSLLPPPRRPNRRIEIVGDSISCGLGVLGVGPTCDPTNENEDHDESYGALTARALGADLITIAWSGKGMYENYGGATTATLPDLYPYSMPTQPAPAVLWTFGSWTPDAVVVDLGTNDFWNGDPGAAFGQTYLAFLQTVRAHYPSAYIFAANGPLLTNPDFTTAETYISGAVNQLQAGGDTRIAYLSFGLQSPSNGYGCDYHPSPTTHQIMATTLEAALSTALGW